MVLLGIIAVVVPEFPVAICREFDAGVDNRGRPGRRWGRTWTHWKPARSYPLVVWDVLAAMTLKPCGLSLNPRGRRASLVVAAALGMSMRAWSVK